MNKAVEIGGSAILGGIAGLAVTGNDIYSPRQRVIIGGIAGAASIGVAYQGRYMPAAILAGFAISSILAANGSGLYIK